MTRLAVRFFLTAVFFNLSLVLFSQDKLQRQSDQSCTSKNFIKTYGKPLRNAGSAQFVVDKNSTIHCGSVGTTIPSESGDGYLMKIDSNGVIVWQKTIGGLGSQGFMRLIKLSDGNFLTSGFDDSDTKFQNFLLKFDTDGNILWRKDFGTTIMSKTFRYVISQRIAMVR